jgi:uncharacterized small protein (DUF1192 family)
MDELAEAKRQLDGFLARLKMMREGKLNPHMLDGADQYSMTSISILQAEQSIAALERKITRLEAENAHRT